MSLPVCPECVDGWVFVEDVVPFQGGYMPTSGAEPCPACGGSGVDITELVEVGAKALVGGPDPQPGDYHYRTATTVVLAVLAVLDKEGT